MRFKEFVTEYSQLKTQRANRDGIDLEVRSDDKNVSIYAYADGRELAHVHFDIQPYVSDVERKKIIVPYDLEVNDRYRGQGIAAIMYDYAKELGYEVQRSYEQTDAGAHFWDKNRGPGSKVWEDQIDEISPERLERYLAHADKHVSNRMDRMSQARQRLSKNYEIYHADRPAGSAQIVDRFEADTPEQARQYYEKFIQNYDSDVDFDLRLRKGTGIIDEARLPNEVEDFLYDLMPDDVGVEEIGPYRIHYEGFTDDCQSSADYRKNPEAVYQQVFADHIAREGGRKPVEQNFTGDEDYPILYSIFRIPRQVKEIARIPQSELGDWGEAGTLEPPKEPVQKKPLPGGSGFTYAVNNAGPGHLEIMIFDGEKLAAEMDLFETGDVINTWRVDTIVVERPYRGRGLGKALYGIALSILKLTLEAGETQTKHGQAMWLMLNSIPGVEIMGYNMVPTAKYQAHKGDKIIKQDKDWTRYTFPVQSGKRSMRSGRPGVGLYTSQASMIAKWTGK